MLKVEDGPSTAPGGVQEATGGCEPPLETSGSLDLLGFPDEGKRGTAQATWDFAVILMFLTFFPHQYKKLHRFNFQPNHIQ